MSYGLNAQKENQILETAEKAKNTLIEMSELEVFNRQELDTKRLQNSNLSFPIEERIVNFESLLKYNDEDLREISKSEEKYHFALSDRAVISTVTVGEKNGEIEAISFNDEHLVNELNQLPTSVFVNGLRNYKMLRVPNLNAYVFVTPNGRAYTSHNGRSLKETYQLKDLMLELKEEALNFQRLYGKAIKEGKLLH